eukprot:757260-Hanusia_phi.AAC.1
MEDLAKVRGENEESRRRRSRNRRRGREKRKRRGKIILLLPQACVDFSAMAEDLGALTCLDQ